MQISRPHTLPPLRRAVRNLLRRARAARWRLQGRVDARVLELHVLPVEVLRDARHGGAGAEEEAAGVLAGAILQ